MVRHHRYADDRAYGAAATVNGLLYVAGMLDPASNSVSNFKFAPFQPILWRNTATGVNAVWYTNGTAIIGVAGLPTVTDQAWTIVGLK